MRLFALSLAVMLTAPQGSPVPILPESVEDVQACADIGMLVDMVWREARGEPYEGQVAVAEVALNRLRSRFRGKRTLSDVILDRLQFSAYNEPIKPLTSAKRESICRAVIEALNGSNLTDGANHYLAPELTRKIRGGTLPDWYDPQKVTAIIGNHEFLKL